MESSYERIGEYSKANFRRLISNRPRSPVSDHYDTSLIIHSPDEISEDVEKFLKSNYNN